jgi:hypothetical protein
MRKQFDERLAVEARNKMSAISPNFAADCTF